ncbi:pyruvate, water dikinase regulatory protein [Longirhabdus pacifica]|uniref:pyruvate, water dikinase regulatory protein n=1 Tax=Longirhabdus pacifica TaxID=2305227 RepID=UPI001008E019|nr:pyruvate, water dikinase regulatory protein [Longirhabdus pacifica]
MSTSDSLIVYVISDSAGETGESVVKAAIAQFTCRNFEIQRIPFIKTKDDIDQVMRTIKDTDGMIVFTLVIPSLRDHVLKQSRELNIECIDILGPIVGSLEQRLGEPSRRKPGVIHRLDAGYFKRVAAVEFAVKYDDMKDTKGILKADIVLVGVSRTSKTPLSMYLANKKYKVANVPLIPEIEPPSELFEISPDKVIGLVIQNEALNVIRKERLRALGLKEDAKYAQMDRIEQELIFAEKVMDKIKCPVIDVSNKAIEETASIILNLMN